MKKKKNHFLRIVSVLFFLFLITYIMSISGYYEAKVARKVALTDEAMREFEKDILNGENVDLKDYIENDDKDYSNKFTNVGEKVSNSLEYIISDGLSGIWDALKVLFFG